MRGRTRITKIPGIQWIFDVDFDAAVKRYAKHPSRYWPDQMEERNLLYFTNDELTNMLSRCEEMARHPMSSPQTARAAHEVIAALRHLGEAYDEDATNSATPFIFGFEDTDVEEICVEEVPT